MTPKKLTVLLVQNLEGFDEPVGDALDDAHLGLRLVLESAQREGHGSELLARLLSIIEKLVKIQKINFFVAVGEGS